MIVQPISAYRFSYDGPIMRLIKDVKVDFLNQQIKINAFVPADKTERTTLLEENFKSNQMLALLDNQQSTIAVLEFTGIELKQKEMQLDYSNSSNLTMNIVLSYSNWSEL